MCETAVDKDSLCALCGVELKTDPGEEPYRDEDDDAICCDCYGEHYLFACCGCRELGHIEDQHNMVVVFDADGAGLPDGWTPGLYLVTDRPYYTSAWVGAGWLHANRLERIAEVPSKAKGDGHPCGHLCLECQHKATTCKLPPRP